MLLENPTMPLDVFQTWQITWGFTVFHGEVTTYGYGTGELQKS